MKKFDFIKYVVIAAAIFALSAWSQVKNATADETEPTDKMDLDDGYVWEQEDEEVEVETAQVAKPKSPEWKYVPGTYLIKTTWGHGTAIPYSNYAPEKDGKRHTHSCGVPAYTQIINYHRCPQYITDTTPAFTVDIEGVNVPVSAMPTIKFDWDNMANKLTSKSTETEIDPIATLYTAWVRAYSVYGNFGAFVNHFGYDDNIKKIYKKDYTDLEWERILKDQIDNGLPVYIQGRAFDNGKKVSSHAFIIDGYDNNGNVHVNTGWNGKRNGFYPTFDIRIKQYHDGLISYDYIHAIINIKPGIGPKYDFVRAIKAGGTYILKDNLDGKDKLLSTINVNKDFTLDLNGNTLTIDISVAKGDGIKIASGKTFTIKDSKSGGVLNVTNAYLDYAGINTADGTLIIESGTVNAKARRAGIGGGTNGNGGKIVINGGTVTATSEINGAGIGGGYGGDGGTIAISGGTVTATSNNGAGIGGGMNGSGGTITIKGGTVTATSNNGAGIGGGSSGDGGTITINGGTTVTATGIGHGSGIGGGSGGSGGKIVINGGTIAATGGFGAGIGGGRQCGSGGEITINGGIVTATGSSRSAGIGGGSGVGGGGNGGNVTITGGMVTATGKDKAKGIGNGQGGTDAGTLKIDGDALVVTNSIGDASPKSGGTLVVGSDTTRYGGLRGGR